MTLIYVLRVVGRCVQVSRGGGRGLACTEVHWRGVHGPCTKYGIKRLPDTIPLADQSVAVGAQNP
jgi:hypothetical protein